MVTRISEPEQSSESEYQRELDALARDLKDLQLVNGIVYRDFDRLSTTASLPVSEVSATLRGKCLPSREFLLALVRVLLSAEDGNEVRHGDGRLKEWDDRWQRLERLERRRDRADRSSPAQVRTGISPGDPEPDPVSLPAPEWARIDFVRPPSDATIQELESAKSDLRDLLSDVDDHGNRLRDEFRQVLNEQTKVAAELRRLVEQLGQERKNSEKLEREVAKLKKLRKDLGKQWEDLRAQLAEIDSDKVDLLAEESELNDRRAMLNFEWARYEEDLRTRAQAEAARLRDELADAKLTLEAADRLIRGDGSTGL